MMLRNLFKQHQQHPHHHVMNPKLKLKFTKTSQQSFHSHIISHSRYSRHTGSSTTGGVNIHDTTTTTTNTTGSTSTTTTDHAPSALHPHHFGVDVDVDEVPPPPLLHHHHHHLHLPPQSSSSSSSATPILTTTPISTSSTTTANAIPQTPPITPSLKSPSKLKNFFYQSYTGLNNNNNNNNNINNVSGMMTSASTGASGVRSKMMLNRTTKDIVTHQSNTVAPSMGLYHSWKMIKFEMDGKVRVVDVPRSDLYSLFGLQGRDIRTVVSNMNYPTILARKRCIVLDIKNLSAIITENAMYLIKNDSFDPSIIPFIQQEIKYHRTASKIMNQESSSGVHSENANSSSATATSPTRNVRVGSTTARSTDFSASSDSSNSASASSSNNSASSSSSNMEENSTSEREHYHTQQYGYYEHSHALPFEFQMLECILHKTCREVEAEYESFQAQVRRTLHDPDLVSSEDLLFEILQHKRYMNKFTTFVREMYEAIDGLLESDEDMASMYLTETRVLNRPRPIDKHEEIEMLLETYVTQLEDILNRIDELKSDINSTQDFLEICLDAVRNRMIEYDLKMTIAGFAITLGTLLAGLFGMNLLNHFEHSPISFFVVSGVICAASITAFAAVMLRLKRRGVFTSAQYFNQKSKRLQEATGGFTAGTPL